MRQHWPLIAAIIFICVALGVALGIAGYQSDAASSARQVCAQDNEEPSDCMRWPARHP